MGLYYYIKWLFTGEHTSVTPSHQAKIYAPHMMEFNGSSYNWKKFKSSTVSSLMQTTGYGTILQDFDYAQAHKGDNVTTQRHWKELQAILYPRMPKTWTDTWHGKNL